MAIVWVPVVGLSRYHICTCPLKSVPVTVIAFVKFSVVFHVIPVASAVALLVTTSRALEPVTVCDHEALSPVCAADAESNAIAIIF